MQHGKTLFVFDWDDVISQTSRLRELTYELIQLAGLSREQIKETSRELHSAGGYNFQRHVRLLIKKYPEKETALASVGRIFDKARDHLGSVVYPDAERFLRRLHGHYPIALLTIGDPEFQQQKMHRSGLDKLFSHMIFLVEPERNEDIPQVKSRALGQLLELYPTIVYFDDRADVLGRVYDEHKHHQRILPFRVTRSEKEARYSHVITSFDHRLPIVLEQMIAAAKR